MKSILKIVAISVLLLAHGCTIYRGGKVVEGTDIAAGMSIPQSGGTFQVDALNYLSGFRFGFAENAGVKCAYTCTNSVSAFGVYESHTVKRIDIELTPTIGEAKSSAADAPSSAKRGE